MSAISSSSSIDREKFNIPFIELNFQDVNQLIALYEKTPFAQLGEMYDQFYNIDTPANGESENEPISVVLANDVELVQYSALREIDINFVTLIRQIYYANLSQRIVSTNISFTFHDSIKVVVAVLYRRLAFLIAEAVDDVEDDCTKEEDLHLSLNDA